jgi:hypothetical protein
MVYLFPPLPAYIKSRWINDVSMKGKTMTQNSIIHVIWDFPVMLFNKGRVKIQKFFADRDEEEARWLNG